MSGPRIRSKIRTKVKDRGYNAIIRELKILENEPCVKVGLPDESRETWNEHKDENGKFQDVTILDIGIFHEFGTDDLPERSWLRAAHDAMVPDMNALIKRLHAAILEGRITVSTALGIMGLLAQKNTKKFLTDNKVKPPSKQNDNFAFAKFGKVANTILKAPKVDVRKNASTKTLIDTAQLLNSITFVKKMKK